MRTSLSVAQRGCLQRSCQLELSLHSDFWQNFSEFRLILHWVLPNFCQFLNKNSSAEALTQSSWLAPVPHFQRSAGTYPSLTALGWHPSLTHSSRLAPVPHSQLLAGTYPSLTALGWHQSSLTALGWHQSLTHSSWLAQVPHSQLLAGTSPSLTALGWHQSLTHSSWLPPVPHSQLLADKSPWAEAGCCVPATATHY